MTSVLSLSSISKSFGDTDVLRDVSLQVKQGEFVSLVGPSGCGKSTLLRLIAGLDVQTSGDVFIRERNVAGLGPAQRNIAMVFQNYALYPHMSVHDNIALPLKMSRLNLGERLPGLGALSPRRRSVLRNIEGDVRAIAAQLRIEPLLSRKPAQLSGGQRQRVALARAMVREPSLFLMDEPLSNLDAQLRVHMRDELADLHRRIGATFIYVTHDQVEAMTMSDRVALLDRGSLVQVDAPHALYQRPATLSVARFIGSPTINTLPALVAKGGGLVLSGRSIALGTRLAVGENVTLAIRPEALILDGASGLQLGPYRVRRVEHHGPEWLIFLSGLEDEANLIARVPADRGEAPPQIGSVVIPSADMDSIHIFDSHQCRVDHEADAGRVYSVAAQ